MPKQNNKTFVKKILHAYIRLKKRNDAEKDQY